MFGGLNDDNFASDELYLLKFGEHKNNRHVFLRPKTKGKTPIGRYMHSMNYFKSSNALIVYGGRND